MTIQVVYLSSTEDLDAPALDALRRCPELEVHTATASRPDVLVVPITEDTAPTWSGNLHDIPWIAWCPRGVPPHARGAARQLTDPLQLPTAALAVASLHAKARAQRDAETLLALSNDVFIVADASFHIRMISPSIERILGWPPAHFLGKHLVDHVHPDDRALAERSFAQLRQGQSVLDLEVDLRTRAGDRVPLRWNAVSDPDRVLFCGHDVSRENLLRERLRGTEAIRLLGRVSAGVAHEFRNLLMVLVGRAELVFELSQAFDLPACDKSIKAFRDCAQRATALTQDLLHFNATPNPEPTGTLQLGPALEQLVPLIQRLLTKRVQLDTDLRDQAHNVQIGRVDFERILMELAGNARDAMPHGGTCSLTLTHEEDDSPEHRVTSWLKLTLSDNGPGLSPEAAERAFDPYFTTKNPGEGIGIGLATVQRIVTDAGGVVKLENLSPHGTRAEVWLPTCSARPTLPVYRRWFETRLLLVVDDTELADTVIASLEERPCHVTTANNLDLARIVWNTQGPFQLVIAELTVGRLDGRAFLTELRAQAPDLQTVLITGYPLHPEDLGSTLVLEKPFTPGQLLDKLDRCVRRLATASTQLHKRPPKPDHST